MGNNILYTTFIIAALIAIIILFFIISIVRYHRRYIKLQRERIFAEITIQENERRRIATDLHDSLGPLLSSVKLQINSITICDPQDQQIINKAGKHLDEIIGSIREISYNLLPNTLQRKGLPEAVKEFIGHINSKHVLNIRFYQTKELTIPAEKEIHIFRMIQEIVHNTLKHAKAKDLQIALGEENRNVLILTKDDGIGFDIEKARKESAGLGLKSIESRAEIMQGVINMESIPGHGTNYFVKIPL
ncbi:MAG TPA: ATP-binding protein [Chitinophagaceae bacterium]|nr:ATP-binding protein [Chitinophagaceae bacterium]